ncbi:hypothetical protein Lac2_19440 [Claveliimonas bilis]|nr:hypothetical protein Lac2_19440 [Claveliimonas bilis]
MGEKIARLVDGCIRKKKVNWSFVQFTFFFIVKVITFIMKKEYCIKVVKNIVITIKIW